MWNLKKKKHNKIVNITTIKKKQTRRCREQTSGYQWAEGSSGEGKCRGKGLRGTNHYVYHKPQGYIAQGEYGQCSIITVNGV